MKRIRILIADDHAVVRIGLSALFGTEKDLEVVGVAANGDEAVTKALALKPDVVVMDLMMPGKSGVEATSEIVKADPSIRILLLTTYATSDGIMRTLDAGASGAILKTAPDDELVSSIRKVCQGERRYLSAEVRQLLADDPPIRELTDRQLGILGSITRGLTNSDIARQFGIREVSVKEHLARIFNKIGAANRAEAVAIVLRKHLLKI